MRRCWLRSDICALVVVTSIIGSGAPLASQTSREESALDVAAALIEDGSFSQALTMLEAMEDDAGGRRLLLFATTLNEVGSWQDALEAGERVAERLPESSAARLQHAIALRNKMGAVSPLRAMTSLGDYKRELAAALELDPENLDAFEEQIGYLINAPGIAGGDKDEARRKIETLTALDELRGLTMQGLLFEALDDVEGSVATFERVLELDPERHRTRFALAMALQGAERWQAADSELERLLDLEPGSRYRVAALYQLGRSRIVGEFDQRSAVDYLDRFLAERTSDVGTGLPSAADALWRRGMAMEQIGRQSDAIASYRRALADDPDHQQAKTALRRLD